MRPEIWWSHYRQKKIYRTNFRRFGDDHRALCWSSSEVQRARFEAFLRIGELQQRRLLDVGCGLGDFFAFLDQREIHADLTAYDIVPEMVACCAKKFPEAHVECRNILLAPPDRVFDYVFASGVFAFGNEVFFREMTKRAFQLCTVAFAFNVYESRSPEHYRTSREAVLAYCRSLQSRRFVLLDDYCESDFTVMLYR